jgi:hypothetical protein
LRFARSHRLFFFFDFTLNWDEFKAKGFGSRNLLVLSAISVVLPNNSKLTIFGNINSVIFMRFECLTINHSHLLVSSRFLWLHIVLLMLGWLTIWYILSDDTLTFCSKLCILQVALNCNIIKSNIQLYFFFFRLLYFLFNLLYFKVDVSRVSLTSIFLLIFIFRQRLMYILIFIYYRTFWIIVSLMRIDIFTSSFVSLSRYPSILILLSAVFIN